MNKILATKLFSKNTIKRLTKKNIYLGNKTNIYNFLLIKLFIIIVILGLIIYFIKNILLGLIIVIPLYFIIEYICYDIKIRKINNKLEYELLFFLDMLIITLESNHNFNKALEITTNNIDSTISAYFKKVLKELNLGKPYNEAITSMMEKIDSNNINNILFNLRECLMYGNDPIISLKEQKEYLNEVILLNLKYKISKLPLKIIIISIFILTPLILLVIFAPVIIDLLK